MKSVNIIVKILAALAAVAGAVFVIATFGDKIVAFAKKLIGCECSCECECDCECECEDCECEPEETVETEEEVVEAEEEVAEEPAAEEIPADAVVATDADFEG